MTVTAVRQPVRLRHGVAAVAVMLASSTSPNGAVADRTSAHSAGPNPGHVILADDRGAVCVISVVRDPRRVSCRHPGARGFKIVGIPAGGMRLDSPGVASLGDVNGDGRDDFAIGVPWATFNGRARAGVTFIVFGARTPHTVDLAHLGADGFRIGGPVAGAQATIPDQADQGTAGGRGDVTGDGLNDVALAGEASTGAGANGVAWLVFGKRGNADVDLAALGTGGFEIHAPPGPNAGIDAPGIVGDVNGDRKADIALHFPPAIVFGKTDPAPVDLARLGSLGERITGLNPRIDDPIVGIGDVNGDGVGDLLVGDYYSGNADCTGGPAEQNAFFDCPGGAFVIYGRRTPQDVDVRHLGSRGFAIRPRYGGPGGGGQNLGGAVAGVGKLTRAGRPAFAVADDTNVYVILADSHGRTLDLRRPGFGQVMTYRQSQGNTANAVGPALVSVGDPPGDLLVEQWVYHRSAYRDFVVFGRSSPRPVDLHRVGSSGFEIVQTADSLPR